MKNKKWINALLCVLGIAAIIAAIILFLPTVLKVIGYLARILMPFIIGYLFSLASNPLADTLQKKFKLPRGVSAVIVIVLVLGIVGGIFGFIVWKVIDEARSIGVQLPAIYENAKNTIHALSDQMSGMYSNLPPNMQQVITSMGENLSSKAAQIVNTYTIPLVDNAGNVAKAVPGVIVGIIVFILSSYFMITDSRAVSAVINRIMGEGLSARLQVVKKELGKYLGGYFKAQVILMFIAFVIIFIGLSVLGVEYALLIALLIAFIDALPFFGSGLVLWPWSVIAFINGNIAGGVGMLIIYLVVQAMRRFAEPKLVSSGMGLNPIPTLMSMYIGYKVWSLGGLIVGPIALMIIISFYKAGVFDTPIRFFKDLWRFIKKQCRAFKNFVFNLMESDWNE